MFSCVKCGGVNVKVAWYPREHYSCPPDGVLEKCDKRVDHLHCTCRRCGYRWSSSCLDAGATPEKEKYLHLGAAVVDTSELLGHLPLDPPSALLPDPEATPAKIMSEVSDVNLSKAHLFWQVSWVAAPYPCPACSYPGAPLPLREDCRLCTNTGQVGHPKDVDEAELFATLADGNNWNSAWQFFKNIAATLRLKVVVKK